MLSQTVAESIDSGTEITHLFSIARQKLAYKAESEKSYSGDYQHHHKIQQRPEAKVVPVAQNQSSDAGNEAKQKKGLPRSKRT